MTRKYSTGQYISVSVWYITIADVGFLVHTLHMLIACVFSKDEETGYVARPCGE